MGLSKWMLLAFAVALPLSVDVTPTALAEPLTPLTQAEADYLQQLHRVFATYRDPAEFRSDGELLDLGRYVCIQSSHGLVGYGATQITPAITQLALIYLCPS